MNADEIAAGRARWQARYDAARKRDADFTTLSGDAVEPVYGPPEGAAYPGFERIGWPGEYPYTRGSVSDRLPRADLDDPAVRRLRQRPADQRALQDDPRRGRRRALRRVRHADADGARLRRPAGARRGRALRRRDRLRRRHGGALRRHRPGRRHHLDDHLRPGRAGLLHVPGRRRAAGRRPVQAGRHAADRHLQGVHRAEGVALRPRAAPAPDRRPDGVLRRARSRATSRCRSPATTSARPARPPRRSWRTPWPTASATSSWACPAGWTSTSSRPG